MKQVLLLLFIAVTLCAAPQFGADAKLSADGTILEVTLNAPPGGYFDAASLAVLAPEGVTASPENLPPARPSEFYDQGIYLPDTSLRYRLTPPRQKLDGFSFSFMACEETICHPPTTIPLTDSATAGGTTASMPEAVPGTGSGTGWRSIAGYHDAEDFAKWLDGTLDDGDNILEQVLSRWGLLAAALLLLPLGALLNLTPCILPMIPINLAVIGARSAGKGRSHGFIMGGIYGAAMAFAYGLAGILFVTLGGRFGAWNSSPWFNYAIALIFCLLALAMFDKLLIDFTRFRRTPAIGKFAPGITAALLGIMSALLAGACVAPVLIWVLLIAARLYSEGSPAALWLPMMLGLGMGLPWPFLGFGINLLPKPGPWMKRVKYLFGALILLAALHYVRTGISLHRSSRPQTGETAAAGNGWHTSPEAAFAEAAATGKPLFIDFWGISCKACNTMDATTLKNPEVTRRLDGMVRLKIQADDFNAPGVAEYVLKYGVIGLPTYIVTVVDGE